MELSGTGYYECHVTQRTPAVIFCSIVVPTRTPAHERLVEAAQSSSPPPKPIVGRPRLGWRSGMSKPPWRAVSKCLTICSWCQNYVYAHEKCTYVLGVEVPLVDTEDDREDGLEICFDDIGSDGDDRREERTSRDSCSPSSSQEQAKIYTFQHMCRLTMQSINVVW